MKKFIGIFLVALLTLFIACDKVIVKRGIESFNIADCDYSGTWYMLPSNEFIAKYSYEVGDYYFIDDPHEMRVIAIMYLQYSPDLYLQAKQYCVDNFILGDVKADSCEGYTFIENITRIVTWENEHDSSTREFPEMFNMFAYNDSTFTLLFTGYRACSDEYQAERDLAVSDFEAFMDSVYSECFSESSEVAE